MHSHAGAWEIDAKRVQDFAEQEERPLMAALTPEQRSHLQAAAKMVDAIVAKTSQTFVDDGLESKQTVDTHGVMSQPAQDA